MYFKYSSEKKTNLKKFYKTNKWYKGIDRTGPTNTVITQLLEVLAYKAAIGDPDKLCPYSSAFSQVYSEVMNRIQNLSKSTPEDAERYKETLDDIRALYLSKLEEQDKEKNVKSMRASVESPIGSPMMVVPELKTVDDDVVHQAKKFKQ